MTLHLHCMSVNYHIDLYVSIFLSSLQSKSVIQSFLCVLSLLLCVPQSLIACILTKCGGSKYRSANLTNNSGRSHTAHLILWGRGHDSLLEQNFAYGSFHTVLIKLGSRWKKSHLSSCRGNTANCFYIWVLDKLHNPFYSKSNVVFSQLCATLQVVPLDMDS